MSIRSVSLRGLASRLFRRSSSLEEKIGLAVFAAALMLVTVQPVLAHEFKIGAIEIEHPWSRATPPGAKVGGGYLTITNDGATADRLIAATAEVAERAEIHEMAVKDGIMTMRPVSGGVEIPAGGSVQLSPGGFHLMLIGLKSPLKKGESFKGTLTFASAGTVPVTFAVDSIAATGKHDDKSMPGMDMGN